MSQRRWLSALLAFRHSGFLQYSWCHALRESGRKKSRQFLHLRLLIGLAIERSSEEKTSSMPEEIRKEKLRSRKKKKKRRERTYCADAFGRRQTGGGLHVQSADLRTLSGRR